MVDSQGFEISILSEEAQRKIKRLDDSFASLEQSAIDAVHGIDKAFMEQESTVKSLAETVGALGGAYLSLSGAKAMVAQIEAVRESFQDAESTLSTFLGSAEKGNQFFNKLKDYAWYNMFEFGDLLEASNQLIAYGNAQEDLIDIIDRLSNIASATKKPLMQYIEMWNKAKNIGKVDSKSQMSWAASGLVLSDELQKMGIKADGASISFEQLQMAINHATDEGGRFHGLMENMMENLSSNKGQLADDWNSMLNDLGQKMEGVFTWAFKAADNVVANYEQIGKTIATIASVFGIYKAAVAAYTVAQRIANRVDAEANLIRSLAAMEEKTLTDAEVRRAMATRLVSAAQLKLNASMLTNPYVMVATAIAGLVAALVLYKNSIKTAQEATEALDESLKELGDNDSTKIAGLADEYDKLSAKAKLSSDETERLKKVTEELAKYMPDAVTNTDRYGKAIEMNTEKVRELAREKRAELIAATKEELAEDERILSKEKENMKELGEIWRSGGRYSTVAWNDGEEIKVWTADSEKQHKKAREQYFETQKAVAELEDKVIKTHETIRNAEVAQNVDDLRVELNALNDEEMEDFKQKLQDIIDCDDVFGEAEKDVIDFSKSMEKNLTETGKWGMIQMAEAAVKEIPKHTIDITGKNGLFTFNFDKLGKDTAIALMDTINGDNKGANTTQELTDAQKKAAYNRQKRMNEENRKLAQSAVEAENDRTQMRINAMKDGAAKIDAQNALNAKKQRESLKKDVEDIFKNLNQTDLQYYLDSDKEHKAWDFKKRYLEEYESLEEAIAALPEKYRSVFIAQQQNIEDEIIAKQKEADETRIELYGTFWEKYSKLQSDWGKKIEQESDSITKERLEKQSRLELAQLKKDFVDNNGGTYDERYNALKEQLDAELELVDEAHRKMVEKQNAYKLATFAYNEVSQYGSFEQRMETTKKKWTAFIETLNSDAEKFNASNAMTAELYDLEKEFNGVYQRIFADINGMSKSMLDNAIAMAEAEFENLSRAGSASISDLNALSERIQELKDAKKELASGGWGGSVEGLMGAMYNRDAARESADRVKKLAAAQQARMLVGKSLDEQALVRLSAEYLKLSDDIEHADDSEKYLNAQIKKQASILVSSKLNNLLASVADTLSEIASISGNDEFSKTAEGLSALSNSLDSIIQGLSHGGLIGAVMAYGDVMLSTISNAVASAKVSHAQYEQFLKDFEEGQKLLALSVDRTKYQNIFGTDEVKLVKDSYGTALKALEEYRRKVAELKDINVETGESFNWSRMWKTMASGVFAPITALTHLNDFTKKTYKSLAEFGELWDEDGMLNVDNARLFLETNKRLTDTQRQEIQNAIDLQQAYKDAMASVESFASSTLGNFASELGNVICDSILSGKDPLMQIGEIGASVIDNFAREMANSFILETYLEQFKGDLTSAFASGSDKSITDVMSQIMNGLPQAVTATTEMVKGIYNYAEEAGMDIDALRDSTRQAVSKSSLGASQESIDESNGRLTAMQGHTNQIMQDTMAIKEINTRLADMAGNILAHVMGIHSDTSSMVGQLEGLQESMDQSVSYLGRVVDKGVKAL